MQWNFERAMEPNSIFYESLGWYDAWATGAYPCFLRASEALTEEKDIEFANILLDDWRILQNECEEISYDQLSGDPAGLAKKKKLIGILSTIILYDLARACYSNLGEYRYPAEDVNEDKAGLCKLNVLAP